jgi:ribokinase
VAAAVVVVGSVNVDLIVRVPSLPSRGETVIGGTFSRAPGGKGGNAAVAAARLGARTWFVGLVGRDDLGGEARRDLAESGVDVSGLGEVDEPTGAAAILVDERGENIIAVASGANASLDGDQVTAALNGIDADHAVLLANLEVPDDAVSAAARAAGDRGWPIVLNPAPARVVPAEVVAACRVVVPNEAEAVTLGGVDELLGGGADAVVVTRGPAGADLHRAGVPVHHQDAFRIDAMDTTGAGDAFCAALAVAVAEGRDLEAAVREAAATGALASRAVGARAGLPTRAEVDRLVTDGPPG